MNQASRAWIAGAHLVPRSTSTEPSSTRRVWIARAQLIGPVTNLAGVQTWSWDAAASNLRFLGYDVWSPMEWSDIQPETWTWDEWLARSFHYLDQADLAVVLRGWKETRISRLEVERAQQLGLPMVDYATGICRCPHRQAG